MGKFNEIQEQTTQSFGSNSFTTTIKEDTVEFDSAKDKFNMKDPVYFDSKLYRKRDSQPIYDEITAVDYVSSYTNGTQIGTLQFNGVNKPIYVRNSVYLDGTYSINRQLRFKMDENAGTLQCSFDRGTTWHTIKLED